MGRHYPNRPIRLVVGFAPGGAADFVARTLAEPLGRALGQPVVIDNRPGAGSSIAAEHVAKSAPDGYTVLIASPSSILVNPLLNKQSALPAAEGPRAGEQGELLAAGGRGESGPGRFFT